MKRTQFTYISDYKLPLICVIHTEEENLNLPCFETLINKGFAPIDIEGEINEIILEKYGEPQNWPPGTRIAYQHDFSRTIYIINPEA